ncbi:MAG: stage II sporulation protein R [Eubacteriales bacterium]|nr:stage II sporulation protein R [Eubacteriales bacterium]MDD3199322.1 stage II sporulation protein R [Eubacteriales bacterium]MDD4475907.1 stage II sporulation protein R [Eubacteriales bacterium]
MGLRKKELKFLIFILICIILFSTWNVYSNPELSNDDFIRFHVIANSDSDKDQQLKLKVRDGILAKINSELIQETMAQELTELQASGGLAKQEQEADEKDSGIRVSLDLDKSREYIQENIIEIEDTAERIIKENGYDYEAKAELGVKWIPKKTYGDVIFPAGNYEALNVTIGEGKGQNWWCVLFPPLCLIGAEETVEQDEIVEDIYKDILLDKKYDPLTEKRDKPATLKLKFKTLELIGE